MELPHRLTRRTSLLKAKLTSPRPTWHSVLRQVRVCLPAFSLAVIVGKRWFDVELNHCLHFADTRTRAVRWPSMLPSLERLRHWARSRVRATAPLPRWSLGAVVLIVRGYWNTIQTTINIVVLSMLCLAL